MGRHTRKIGIVGKYGTRYGSSLRKQIKKIEISQRTKFTCSFCGKKSIKRKSTGIWKCKACNISFAGGAWSLVTETGLSARATLKRIKEL